MAFELGIERRWVTVNEFLNHAAVIKIESDRAKFSQATTDHRPQRGVEKFDYISAQPVKIDEVLIGDQLLNFFGEDFLTAHLIYGDYQS